MANRRIHEFSAIFTAALIALPLSVASPGAYAAMNNGGGAANETTCEVVSVGNWYCTIDGKGYYCTKKDNPDKNKDCMPALRKGKPNSISRLPGGVMKQH